MRIISYIIVFSSSLYFLCLYYKLLFLEFYCILFQNALKQILYISISYWLKCPNSKIANGVDEIGGVGVSPVKKNAEKSVVSANCQKFQFWPIPSRYLKSTDTDNHPKMEIFYYCVISLKFWFLDYHHQPYSLEYLNCSIFSFSLGDNLDFFE